MVLEAVDVEIAVLAEARVGAWSRPAASRQGGVVACSRQCAGICEPERERVLPVEHRPSLPRLTRTR